MSDVPNVTPAVPAEPSTGDAAVVNNTDSTLLTSSTGDDSSTDQGDTGNTGDASTTNQGDAGNTGDAGDTGQSGDNADVSKGAPETYSDFEMPEGFSLDQAKLDAAVPVFKELGLSQEQAQKLVSLQTSLMQDGLQKQQDDFNQLIDNWSTQAKSDAEFGGDNFEQNVTIARKALDTYGTPELKQLMDTYGIGNNPEVIRFMYKVGQTLKEDNPVDSTGQTASQGADRLSILYPKG